MTSQPKSGTPKAPTKAKVATKTISFGKLTLSLGEGVEVPDLPASRNPLPFAEGFDAMAKIIKPGSNVHVFLPDRFWHDRGTNADLVVRSGYTKTRLRDAFKAWQSKSSATRDVYAFTAVRREKGDIVEGAKLDEAGTSYWLLYPNG